MDFTLSTNALALVPIIMILTSLAKNVITDSRWSPLVALVLSLLASFFLVPVETVAFTVLQGILMSLSASGLYSGTKAVVKG